MTTVDRFWANIQVEPNTGCWLWSGWVTDKGYARFRDCGQKVRVHRWAYEHFRGPIPDGLVIDHLCNTPSCVNPAHLEPKTSRENILRGHGATAVHARKTHCPQGHPYDEENTYRPPNGQRKCRGCRRANTISRRVSAVKAVLL